MLENIIKGNKKWRGLLLVGIVAALGIALIIVSGAGGLENKSESVTEQSSYDDADAYARALEQRIAELCSSVRGAGDVKVMVSLVHWSHLNCSVASPPPENSKMLWLYRLVPLVILP